MCKNVAAFAALLVIVQMAVPLNVHSQSLRLDGRVLDSTTGAPVAAADIRLLAITRGIEFRANTRLNGAFSFLALPHGTYVARVDRVGYVTLQDTVEVNAGTTGPLEFRLVPAPVPISEVKVETRARAPLDAMHGFWQRRERNLGHFITRADIDSLRPHRTADLFRVIPGARIQALGDGRVAVFGRVRSIDGRVCVPATFVDGVPYVMTHRGLDDFNPTGIEAVEVYTGSARIPAEFNVTGRDQPAFRNDQIIGTPRCGVVVIWTRRGGN